LGDIMSSRHQHYPEEECSDDQSQDETLRTLVPASKKRGRHGPSVLMGPLLDRDKAVITPLNKEPLDQHSREVPVEDAKVIAHYHNYPSLTRRIILNEFLKCFKFAPGREEECACLFERKAVERFSQALSYEKSQAKRSLEKFIMENNAIEQLEQDGDDFPKQLTNEAHGNNGVNDFDAEDPLLWKPFPPSWIEKKWWDMLCDLWSNANVKKVSAQNSKNRKNGGGAHHTCGSQSIAMHKHAMIVENGGQDVDDLDVFARTHRHDKGKGQYVNRKVEELVNVFNERVKEGNDNQVEKQNIWVQLTGGRKHGRYYGLPGVIDRDQVRHSSSTTPSVMFNSAAMPLAMRNINQEFGTRIQSLEHRVDKPTLQSHSHDAHDLSTNGAPDFLDALNMVYMISLVSLHNSNIFIVLVDNITIISQIVDNVVVVNFSL
ncbi:hypothetical protein U9M48_002594, partial [Paspalum notatum var. saurae]